MKLLALNCNHCGAPIEVPAKVRYLTCEFCESKLEVKHEGNAHFTEALETIQAELAELKIRDRMRTIDDGWEKHRQRLMVTDKHGRFHVPTKAGAAVFGVVGTIIGIVALAALGGFGLLIVAVALIGAFFMNAKASAYQRAYQAYRHQRQTVLRELREAEAS